MNFLYPQILFGLFALAIPVIIHLFNFRKAKKVYFSNTRFLREVKESSSSKLKIKHYLILLSRMLALAFLVFAFAQPYWNEDNASPASDKLVIYLDNSWSMSAEAESGLTAFEDAITYANELLSNYPVSTQVKFITNDFSTFSSNYHSAEETIDYLTKIGQSSVTRSSQEIMERIVSHDLKDSVDLYWISDFQSSSVSPDTQIDSAYRTFLVPINLVSTNNIAIDSIYLENPFQIDGKSVKLNVLVNNRGIDPIVDLSLKAFIDGTLAATTLINLKANETSTVSFELNNADNTEKIGRLTIEDYPVTFDNEFYFILGKSKRIKVLEINSEEAEDYVRKVYANDQLFDLTSFEEGNIDFSKLKDVDLIVLNGLKRLTSSLSVELQKLRTSGKTILVIPNSQPDIASYSLLVNQIAASNAQDTIPLASPDISNPFYKDVFEDDKVRFSTPSTRPVLSLGTDRNAVLKLQNGQPFLRAFDNVYVMAAPLINDFSSFQTHALFVPVMYRLAVQGSRESDNLFYYISENILSINIDSLGTNSVYKLRSDNQEIIPEQRAANGKLILEMPKYLLEAGFYDVQAGDQSLKKIAFNHSSIESNLETIPREKLQQYITGNTSIVNSPDQESFRKELKNRFDGTPLWKYALILALLFLLAEVLLIRFL